MNGRILGSETLIIIVSIVIVLALLNTLFTIVEIFNKLKDISFSVSRKLYDSLNVYITWLLVIVFGFIGMCALVVTGVIGGISVDKTTMTFIVLALVEMSTVALRFISYEIDHFIKNN